MKRILLLPVAAVLAAAGSQNAQQDFRWSGRIAQGDEIEVVGIAGEIRAVPSSGNMVEVVGEMRGQSVPVRVLEHEGGVTLCVEYPGMRRGQGWDAPDRRFRGRCNMQGNVGENPTRVDFTVRVPAGVAFTGRTVQGDVRAEGLRSRVRASTVSGEIDVQTSDVAEASSVSGDVHAVMGRLPGSGSLRFSSVSGDVRLGLPADAGAELRANTLSGEIDSDFPLTLGGRDRAQSYARVGQKMSATIGRGGVGLDISTVSGDIELERNR